MHNRHHVLVVDDDDAIRRLLVEYLKQHPFLSVDAARDGAEALHQVSVQRYDVVVLDVVMPHMTGVDFLESLQAMTSDPSLHPLRGRPAILVVTSTPESELPDQLLHQRFPSLVHGVFRKPVDVPQLGEKVGEQLRLR